MGEFFNHGLIILGASRAGQDNARSKHATRSPIPATQADPCPTAESWQGPSRVLIGFWAETLMTIGRLPRCIIPKEDDPAMYAHGGTQVKNRPP
jgi:hypothetical protein